MGRSLVRFEDLAWKEETDKSESFMNSFQERSSWINGWKNKLSKAWRPKLGQKANFSNENLFKAYFDHVHSVSC